MTVGWARFCAHADTKPRGQTINLSAHPTLFSENKFTLLALAALLVGLTGGVHCAAMCGGIGCMLTHDGSHVAGVLFAC